MPYRNQVRKKLVRTSRADRLDHTAQEAATEEVCDLLACAEEAALRGQCSYALFMMHRAEQAALHSGVLSLIRLVWEQTPGASRMRR